MTHILFGLILGVGLVELGFRFYFTSYEPLTGYFEPGALRVDTELFFRHVPSKTVSLGKHRSFGPHTMSFNRLGYRDRREVPNLQAHTFRVMVAGASIMLGVGVDRYEDLFHVQLERLLLPAPRPWERVEVYNVAQVAYRLRQVVKLSNAELRRLQPHVLILSLPRAIFSLEREKDVDVVNGIVLARDRWGADTVLDAIRTRSYLFQYGYKKYRLIREYFQRSFQRKNFLRPRIWTALKVLEQWHTSLRKQGIVLICLLPRPNRALKDVLRKRAFTVLEIPYIKHEKLPRDYHWSPQTHARAADVVAQQIQRKLLYSKAL